MYSFYLSLVYLRCHHNLTIHLHKKSTLGLNNAKRAVLFVKSIASLHDEKSNISKNKTLLCVTWCLTIQFAIRLGVKISFGSKRLTLLRGITH